MRGGWGWGVQNSFTRREPNLAETIELNIFNSYIEQGFFTARPLAPILDLFLVMRLISTLAAGPQPPDVE